MGGLLFSIANYSQVEKAGILGQLRNDMTSVEEKDKHAII